MGNLIPLFEFRLSLDLLIFMPQQIILNNQIINYHLRVSRRARRLGLTIYGTGELIVTLPWRMGERLVEKFMRQKANWILRNLAKRPETGEVHQEDKQATARDYRARKDEAWQLITERVEHFNKLYGFTYAKISIRNQKTRWGSCSRRGNLNFNFRLINLPESLRDYVIIHELCHLGELNHSSRFWRLVARACPDHHHLRRELKQRIL